MDEVIFKEHFIKHQTWECPYCNAENELLLEPGEAGWLGGETERCGVCDNEILLKKEECLTLPFCVSCGGKMTVGHYDKDGNCDHNKPKMRCTICGDLDDHVAEDCPNAQSVSNGYDVMMKDIKQVPTGKVVDDG